METIDIWDRLGTSNGGDLLAIGISNGKANLECAKNL